MRFLSGVTDQYLYFVAVDATNLKTRETGITVGNFSCYRSRNGAAAAAYTTPTFAQVDATNMPGVYTLLLDEDMTIAAGNDSEEMTFHIKDSGGVMAPVTRSIELYRGKITAGQTALVDSNGRVDVSKWLGNAVTHGTGGPDVNVNAVSDDATAAQNLELMFDGTGYAGGTAKLNVQVGGMDTDVMTADALATDFGDEIADQVWDEPISTHAGSNTAGLSILQRASGVVAATSTTVTVTADVPGIADTLVGRVIEIVSGTGAGQSRLVTAYSAARVATITPAWTTTPTTGSTWRVNSGPDPRSVAAEIWNGDATDYQAAGSFGEALGDPAGTGNSIRALVATLDTVADGIQTDLSNGTDGLGALKTLIDLIPTTAMRGTDDGATAAALAVVDGNVDLILADSNELQGDWANGGRLDLLLDKTVAAWTTALTESYSALNGSVTPAQALHQIISMLQEKASSDVTLTAYKQDGSTVAMTFTADDATNPTSLTRAS